MLLQSTPYFEQCTFLRLAPLHDQCLHQGMADLPKVLSDTL